jgi:hypothetical protein
LHGHIIKISKKYNIELDKEKLEKYKKEEKSILLENINKERECINHCEKQIKEIENL